MVFGREAEIFEHNSPWPACQASSCVGPPVRHGKSISLVRSSQKERDKGNGWKLMMQVSIEEELEMNSRNMHYCGRLHCSVNANVHFCANTSMAFGSSRYFAPVKNGE